jgi:uncharacterized integral membrane protein
VPTPDPKPSPINDNPLPVIDQAPAQPTWPLGLICLGGFMVGSVFGVGVVAKQYTHKRRKPARK